MGKLKTIELSTEDAKTLVELLFRGQAYTDAYYRDYKRMDRVYHNVVVQLEVQGGELGINGEISFKKKSKTITK